MYTYMFSVERTHLVDLASYKCQARQTGAYPNQQDGLMTGRRKHDRAPCIQPCLLVFYAFGLFMWTQTSGLQGT